MGDRKEKLFLPYCKEEELECTEFKDKKNERDKNKQGEKRRAEEEEAGEKRKHEEENEIAKEKEKEAKEIKEREEAAEEETVLATLAGKPKIKNLQTISS